MFYQDMGIIEVRVGDLGQFAAEWLNKYRRTMAARTTQRRITSLRCLGAALGFEILKGYNAPTASRGKPHPLPDGKDDLQHMLDLAEDEQQKILVVLLGMCGLRISEARAVAPSDINLRDRTLKVFGKGSKERIVPISDRAWDIMVCRIVQAQLDNQPTLLTYADRSARYAITALAKRAGVDRRIASHDLRATFATEAYNASDKDIRAVQELLGHAQVTQTQLYVDVADESLRQAVNFMNRDGDQ